MPPRLRITPEDCSPLGRIILKYLDGEAISMNRLADLSGVAQPRLRGACLRGTCPTPETLKKLAKVMGMHHLELYTLAYEGRFDTSPIEGEPYTLNMLVRELFETAREMGLAAPQAAPSKSQLCKALLELGFSPDQEQV